MQNTVTAYDVLGIGNAIVDVLSFCEESFLSGNDLAKGSMMLVDQARSQALYAKMGQSTECSGGSVANSLAGMASLGAKTAFIGKVAGDQLGAIFTHDMRSVGVHFDTPPTRGDISTANCLVLVTPDAQRTMATYIGACSLVSEADIDESLVAASGVTYIEGYLWDTENAKAAIRKATSVAKKSGKKTAFTLSDTFCVDRHREAFMQLITKDVDILFANESEVKSLFQVDDFASAVKKLRGVCEVAAVTRSEKGCVILTQHEEISVATGHVQHVVDTTGAGDLFASGFLFGYSRGWSMEKCAALGNRCAGHIITQLGARSQQPLATLVA
jgi:sugar/nucleoside kinase (ribokinase family)